MSRVCVSFPGAGLGNKHSSQFDEGKMEYEFERAYSGHNKCTHALVLLPTLCVFQYRSAKPLAVLEQVCCKATPR